MSNGRFWMWFWAGVVVLTAIQTVVFGLLGVLDTTLAISIMSIEALVFSAGAGFQATLGMRKADPQDPL